MIHNIKKSSTKPINEATSDNSGGRGSFVSPLKPGKRIFDKSQLSPFDTPVSKFFSQLLATDSYDGKMDTPKKDRKNIESKARIESKKTKSESNKLSKENGAKKINEWIEINEETVDEDLAVWFGTKKKPKGSNQPKGPWVNICSKVDGKHPPCGRKKATDKSYPKCRAAGVAGKMTDAEKKAACAQKRKAEKSNPKTGTGNKPKMVSYKTKKNDSK
jgi:hypothetical protein